MKVIVEHMVSFDEHVRQQVFDALKEEQRKNYRNYSLKPSKLVTYVLFGHYWPRWSDHDFCRLIASINFPMKQFCRDARLTLLHTGHWSIVDKYHAVGDITLSDVKAFVASMKETFFLECLVQGNYSRDLALEVARHFKRSLQPQATQTRNLLSPVRICRVPTGQKICRLRSFHQTDSNSVVVNYYQTGPTNIHQMAVMEILVVSSVLFHATSYIHFAPSIVTYLCVSRSPSRCSWFQNLMEEPVFDVLRTQEQLGYNVYVTLRNTFGVLGFSISVDFQADKFR